MNGKKTKSDFQGNQNGRPKGNFNNNFKSEEKKNRDNQKSSNKTDNSHPKNKGHDDQKVDNKNSSKQGNNSPSAAFVKDMFNENISALDCCSNGLRVVRCQPDKNLQITVANDYPYNVKSNVYGNIPDRRSHADIVAAAEYAEFKGSSQKNRRDYGGRNILKETRFRSSSPKNRKSDSDFPTQPNTIAVTPNSANMNNLRKNKNKNKGNRRGGRPLDQISAYLDTNGDNAFYSNGDQYMMNQQMKRDGYSKSQQNLFSNGGGKTGGGSFDSGNGNFHSNNNNNNKGAPNNANNNGNNGNFSNGAKLRGGGTGGNRGTWRKRTVSQGEEWLRQKEKDKYNQQQQNYSNNFYNNNNGNGQNKNNNFIRAKSGRGNKSHTGNNNNIGGHYKSSPDNFRSSYNRGNNFTNRGGKQSNGNAVFSRRNNESGNNQIVTFNPSETYDDDLEHYRLRIDLDGFTVDKPCTTNPILTVPLSGWEGNFGRGNGGQQHSQQEYSGDAVFRGGAGKFQRGGHHGMNDNGRPRFPPKEKKPLIMIDKDEIDGKASNPNSVPSTPDSTVQTTSEKEKPKGKTEEVDVDATQTGEACAKDKKETKVETPKPQITSVPEEDETAENKEHKNSEKDEKAQESVTEKAGEKSSESPREEPTDKPEAVAGTTEDKNEHPEGSSPLSPSIDKSQSSDSAKNEPVENLDTHTSSIDAVKEKSMTEVPVTS